MPKLILSSCDFRNEVSAKAIFDNLPKSIEACRVLFFPNEKATEDAIIRGKYNNRLTEFGFKSQNVTVFNYFHPQDLVNAVFDVIYISGGNTFGTIKHIRESGADKLIVDYVNLGVLYIGGSAGAHVVSAEIEHVKKYDVDTFGICEFSGLGLYNGILICHYTDAKKEHFEFLKTNSKYPMTALKDDEYIVFEY